MKLAIALFIETQQMTAKDIEMLRDTIRDFTRSATFCRGGRLLGEKAKTAKKAPPKTRPVKETKR